MILGLDISTSCTGWCLLDEDGKLSSMGYIDLKREKGSFKKADVVKSKIKEINLHNPITDVFIEENLQSFRSGFSSAQTLSTLARFNGIISYICFEEFGFEPRFLNVNRARKRLGIKIIRKKDGGKPTKEQVLEWVSTALNSTGHVWPSKTLKSGPRKNQIVLVSECYDRADAYVIASAGLMNI